MRTVRFGPACQERAAEGSATKAQGVVTVVRDRQCGKRKLGRSLRVVLGKNGISSQSNETLLEALNNKGCDPIWF